MDIYKKKDIDKNKEIGDLLCSNRSDILLKEVSNMSQYDTEMFNKVYKEIGEALGIEAALTMHQMFKGTQVSFPIKFFNNSYIKERILAEYDGTNVSILARKYDYMEKSIRRIVKQSLREKDG